MTHEQLVIYTIELIGENPPTRMACRAFVQQILGTHLHVENKPSLVFDDYGKPVLKGFEHLNFSYAHSRTLLVVAVSLGAKAVGVDTEPTSRIKDLLEIKDDAFSSIEKRSLSDDRLVIAWCRKEAAVKRLGKGFRDANPSEFTVTTSHKSYKLQLGDREIQRGHFLDVVLGGDIIAVCTDKPAENFLLHRYRLKDIRVKE